MPDWLHEEPVEITFHYIFHDFILEAGLHIFAHYTRHDYINHHLTVAVCK
jgi:hypothetical protein